MPDDNSNNIESLHKRILKGGAAKYHEKLTEQKKLFVRQRLELLLDPGFQIEDAQFANCTDAELPADGVVTGVGKIAGRTVCFMGNDSTVKAGSWGRRTVEKIIRLQETAMKLRVPIIYLVDSAGARITDQVEMFPGRRGAGRIFYNQVQLSGLVPQVCLLFGPSAAGGAYIPAFCDIVIMVEGNASMYLGSPRMAEMVIGEKVSLEEMGGARMHCTVSGCGDILAKSEKEAIELCKQYLSYMSLNCNEAPPGTTFSVTTDSTAHKVARSSTHSSAQNSTSLKPSSKKRITDIIPQQENTAFNMYEFIDALVDANSFFEIKKLFAPEIITGFAGLAGRVVGIVASQPAIKGGVLFVDSADKAARFVWLCDAFNIPLLFLADVPGFMVGSQVEKQGIIRAGAKMISAVSSATVPKISVIVRKAYGAGLYAMCGPAFEPDACLALPTACIAVMGPEAAVNAVYYNKIMELPESQRKEFVEQKRQEYRKDVDLQRLASEMVIDGIVSGDSLRQELIDRFTAYTPKKRHHTHGKKQAVLPV